MSWNDVVQAVKGEPLSSIPAGGIMDICTDTRHLQVQQLYVPLVGEKFDGHDFIQQALEKDAAGCLLSRKDAYSGKGVAIYVEDTKQAYADLAQFWRSQFTLPVIAVTGSNGKTTVKEMTAGVLSQRWNVLKTQGTFNNRVGVPKTILQLRKEHQAAVLELGINLPGEMAWLSRIVQPTVALITNVGRAHLEGLQSIENVAKEKAELFRALPKDGTAVINLDNEWIKEQAKDLSCKKITFGKTPTADVEIVEWKQSGAEYVDVELNVADQHKLIQVFGHGWGTVCNAASVVGVSLALGLNWEEIEKGLQSYQAPPMRMQVVQENDVTYINDAYNANPDSMTMALQSLAHWQTSGKKIAVLGDMLELGSHSEEGHQWVGAKVAESKLDYLCTVGTFAQIIAQSALKAGMSADKVKSFDDHASAAKALDKLIKPKDVVLFKGSRGAAMERVLAHIRQ